MRRCVCSREIPTDESIGPVSHIKSLKFYKDASLFGRPTSVQSVFFCEECTPEFVSFLRGRQQHGPGPREVSE